MRLKEIKPGMVIHCKTKEEMEELSNHIEFSIGVEHIWNYGHDGVRRDCIEINDMGQYDGFCTYDYFANEIGCKITEFSDLILPELTAEEVLQAMGEICNSQQFCNDCPISKAIKDNGKGTSYCFNKLHTHTDKVINVCAQWKSDHEKKDPEIETEWFWQGRIFKINEDDWHCQINDGTGKNTAKRMRESLLRLLSVFAE